MLHHILVPRRARGGQIPISSRFLRLSITNSWFNFFVKIRRFCDTIFLLLMLIILCCLLQLLLHSWVVRTKLIFSVIYWSCIQSDVLLRLLQKLWFPHWSDVISSHIAKVLNLINITRLYHGIIIGSHHSFLNSFTIFWSKLVYHGGLSKISPFKALL